MQNKEIKIQHFGKDVHQELGSFTIATRLTSDNVVEYGVAFCSPKDVFTKKKGNALATERLVSVTDGNVTKMGGVAFVNVPVHADIVFAVLSAIVANNQLPEWARTLVCAYLNQALVQSMELYNETRSRRRKFILHS